MSEREREKLNHIERTEWNKQNNDNLEPFFVLSWTISFPLRWGQERKIEGRNVMKIEFHSFGHHLSSGRVWGKTKDTKRWKENQDEDEDEGKEKGEIIYN